jgi:hypothetical protein
MALYAAMALYAGPFLLRAVPDRPGLSFNERRALGSFKDARRELLECMKLVDSSEFRLMHVELAEMVEGIDSHIEQLEAKR